MNEIIAPIIRRAILDLLNDIGGEHNDQTLATHLNLQGHRVARRDVAEQIAHLAELQLLITEVLGIFIVARITSDGRDVAEGRMNIDGISRFKTGE
ncbi:hypothetical protein [Sphingomonas sp. SRS2]|uniref:hypothetical protein n=1 Tax=Sphingomonas sp. SRS2 TaxID=133190 RepID=UPI0006183F29|nr:hypothetical protein [Sphingomonas sp. SRS2]KKC27419.1 hypothetical protein WP12_03285 [Sphingomonas sp. SRS2]